MDAPYAERPVPAALTPMVTRMWRLRMPSPERFATGLTFVAAAFGINYLFERRSLKLWAINAGYNVIAFTVMGVIIGALQAA